MHESLVCDISTASTPLFTLNLLFIACDISIMKSLCLDVYSHYTLQTERSVFVKIALVEPIRLLGSEIIM